MIYLNHASTTQLSENVKKNIIENLNNYTNPSDFCGMFHGSSDTIKKSREIIAKTINCKPSEIFFTSGASESNSLALQRPFYCENYEHHSITKNKNRVYSIKDADIISKMLVNNEVGFINEIKSLKSEYKDKLIHCDATQAIGNIKVDVKELNVDMLSFSGHKIHAPKGIGVLYVKSGVKLSPIIYGGKQEKGLRGGTENILGISSLGIAIQDSVKNIDIKNKHCCELKELTLKLLNEYNVDYIVNGNNTISSILSVSIKDQDSESIVLRLIQKEICISNGSACNSGTQESNDVLKWLEVDDKYINGTIRISFDLINTKDEIALFVDELLKIIK